jgi:hypothetical protein
MDKMVALAESFPSFRGVFENGWSVERLSAWWKSGAPTGGSRHVAAFLLNVWNCSTTASEWARYGFRGLGAFNVVKAMGTWDPAHRDAFLRWCREPFFP